MKFIYLFIALSLSVAYFFQVQPYAFGSNENLIAPYNFTAMSKSDYHLDKLWPVWQPRIGGMWITGKLTDACYEPALVQAKFSAFTKEQMQSEFGFSNGDSLNMARRGYDPDKFRFVFCAYNAAWILALFIAFIVFVKEPLVLMFGTLAGLAMNDVPISQHYHMPWDAPAMFFFTLSFLLWMRGKYNWMLAVILIGYPFKETVLVTGVLFFFANLNWWKRVGYFLAAVAVTSILKFFIMRFVTHHIMILTQDFGRTAHPEGPIFKTLWDNLRDVFSCRLDHIAFVNGGLLLIGLLLTARTREQKAMKVLLCAFFVGELFAGCFNEFRIMMEVLPICVFYVMSFSTAEKSDDSRLSWHGAACFDRPKIS